MSNSAWPPVKFTRPPVVEVVFSVHFALSEDTLKTAHIGLFWESIRGKFPNTVDVAPVQAIVESAAETTVEMQLDVMPPMRRVWFMTEDGRNLVQLQQDRFIFNWKRVKPDDEYPSYDQVVADFRERFDEFTSFLRDQSLGELTFRQLELTYVNHIPNSSLSGEHPATVLVDYSRANASSRFLPPPTGFKWASGYELPNGAGRLHVVCQTARVQQEPVVRMDLTARGGPQDPGFDGCCKWFDTAHEWITQGFTDLTTPKMHAVWGRTQ